MKWIQPHHPQSVWQDSKAKFKFASIFFFDLFMLLWIFIIVQNLFVDLHLTLSRLEEKEGALFYNKLYISSSQI